MYLIGAFFFWLIGITMVLKPELVYQIKESWKHASGTDPSERYIRSVRFGGAVYLLAGILCVVMLFIT